ncbi:MAG: PRC-barrel domain-containing protein [Ilumatobacteraceae bacterium]
MSTYPTADDDRGDDRQPLSLTGHTVIDDHHEKVGTVSDVLYDERGDAQWAVVDPGPLRAEKFVPVEGAYMSEQGDVVLPFGKDQVKHAPKAGRDHVMDSRTAAVVREHYDAH